MSGWVSTTKAVWALLCVSGLVQAHAESVRIDAELSEDLRSLSGTICAEGFTPTWLDPIASLPEPEDDRTALRTWPMGRRPGSVRLSESPQQGCTEFLTTFPERIGSIGWTRRWGSWANGGWHPISLTEGRLRAREHHVHIHSADDSVHLVVGDALGRGTVRWSGVSRSPPVAFRSTGQVVQIEGTNARLLGTGPRLRRWGRELSRIATWDWQEGVELSGLVVMAPLRRRMLRAGDGVLFLSDRAFRVSPGLERYHRAPVARGWLASSLPTADGWDRAFAADTLVRDVLERTPDITKPLKWLAWHPVVDAFLHDGTTPFFSALIREPWPSDPLQDALDERFLREVPGGVGARWVDDGYGEGTALSATRDWLQQVDAGMAEHLVQRGVDEDWLRVLRTVRPNHAFTVSVEGVRLQVEKRALGDQVSVPVVLEIDGVQRVWFSEPGSDTLSVDLPDVPEKVALDPGRHLGQEDLSDDRWPQRWTMVFVSGFSSIDLSEMDGNAEAAAIFRPAYDSRSVVYLDAFRNAQAEAGVKIFGGRYFGQPLDRRLREHRVYGWLGAEWLRGEFLPDGDDPLAFTAGMSWTWDTRVDWRFPMGGHAMSLAGEVGRKSSGAVGWQVAEGNLAFVHAVHPRLAFATGVGGGVAGGDLPAGWLRLGGAGNLRSVSADWVVGRTLHTAAFETRMVPLRHANIPVVWGWWTDLELVVALEYGRLTGAQYVEESPPASSQVGVLGMAFEAFVGVDALGVRPGRMGVGYARPLEVRASHQPERHRVYLTYLHAF